MKEMDASKWTGSGFMKVYDGGKLRFNLMHGYTNGLYDIVMRYEPNAYDWENILVSVRNLRNTPPQLDTCSVLVRQQKEIEKISIQIQNSNFL